MSVASVKKDMRPLARRIRNQDNLPGFLFTLPFLLGFVLLTVVPIGIAIYQSFTEYNILNPAVYIGLDNYREIFSDKLFYKSLKATLYYTVASVPLRLVFALLVALLMFNVQKFSGTFRAIYYLPSMMGGSVAIAIVWKNFFATNGVFNSILGVFGIKTNYAWLGHTETAIWTLILLSVWQFGSAMLIFLANMKQIPHSYYESAAIDGANATRSFFSVTLPLLTPTIFFNLIMQMIQAFLQFTKSMIITNGKPLNSTLFYVLYMYRQSFDYYKMGYGCALAVIMLIIICTVTAILFGTKKYWVFEDA